ncbi:AMP-binding protein [Streptomyces sp. NPDC058656]|uniref:AMP-binding protein n=1 Tax=Streptomyces sp. NPDC058656 TaxID=3346578 RepID=UPI00364886DC
MIGHPGAAVDAMTVPGLLAAAAEEFGDRVFLRVGDVTRTYRQSRRAAAEMAGALAARGCRPGDRVAVMAGNRIEFVDLILGCAWLGAVLVPLNTGLRGQGLRHIMREARPSFLLAEAESADRAVEAGFRGTLWILGEDDVPAPGEAPAVPSAPARPQDTVFVLFTSGTTGTPRGVLCPHAQTVWWGRNVADSLRLTADDVLHTCLPLFHTNALNTLAHAMTVGATCVIGERFSATRYWDQVAQSGATAVYLLGAMAPMLLAQPPGRHDRAHRAWRGLSPATPASWRRTGDRVVREPDGSYRFVDRVKDVIRRRGENISSFEVESAVRSHPAVADAAAFPVASELAEDEVMVAVLPRPGSALDLHDLVRHCERELPAFAVPRFIETVPELPLTETGKVRKTVLRERGVTAGTWDRAAGVSPVVRPQPG